MEQILLVNPRRRKRKSSRRRARSRRAHRAVRAHRRRRHRGGFRIRRRRLRNPMGGLSVRGATAAIVPAVVGAGGALALDIAMAYIPVPDSFKSGWMKTIAQLGLALGLGWVVGRFVPFVSKRNAQIGTLGALTVIAYNAIRPIAADAIGDKVKGLQGLSDFGDYLPSMGAYMRSPGVGAYMQPAAALLPGKSPIAARQMSGYGMAGTFSEDMFG